MGDDALVESSRAVLQEHGRSFAWAAPVLPRQARADAAIAYAFCRLVDDLADEAPSVERAERDLSALRRELDGEVAPRPLIDGWRQMERRLDIDPRAARDLMTGVLSDLNEVRVRDDAELVLYGYRVAGTVGMMMARIIGVEEPAALRHALDLGIGMQLTNICRDVAEDARRGRVYLPADRLRAAGVEPDALVAGDYDRAAVASVVRDLVALADRFYASADDGMRFIPARPRLAIWIAARVYRAIGLKVARRGVAALEQRVWVTTPGKVVWTGAALLAFCGLGRLPSRGSTDEVSGRQLLPA